MTANSDASLKKWLLARTSVWQQLDTTVTEIERGQTKSAQEALATIDGYRSLGRDLSVARRVTPDGRLTQAIEQLFARMHAVIHRRPMRLGERLLSLFREEIPAIAAQLRPAVLWISLLFCLSTIAAYWLTNRYPELANLFASEEMIAGVENGRLWTEGLFNVVPSSVLSVGILTNNIIVSLFAVCIGVFFGLGTFYLIAMNGAMLGSMLAFTHQHGMAGELLEFIMAHGVVEISVICVAGAGGAMIGEALIRPTHLGRRESFRHAVGKVIKVLLLCAILLVGCGFIEGYISPNPDIPMAARAVIGFGYWLVMIAAFTGHLFGRRAAVR